MVLDKFRNCQNMLRKSLPALHGEPEMPQGVFHHYALDGGNTVPVLPPPSPCRSGVSCDHCISTNVIKPSTIYKEISLKVRLELFST